MQKYAISVCIMFLISFTFIACSNNQAVLVDDSTEQENLHTSTETDIATEVVMDNVCIYVCGAVVNPGVYYIEADSIKKDALDAAGGFLEDAAVEYINLAEPVKDGEKIYFPYEGELESGIGVVIPSEDEGKVNINTASADELMTLPGIGANKADAIIKYRDEYGPFDSIEDIKAISGIKDGVYNNIKDFIVVN